MYLPTARCPSCSSCLRSAPRAAPPHGTDRRSPPAAAAAAARPAHPAPTDRPSVSVCSSTSAEDAVTRGASPGGPFVRTDAETASAYYACSVCPGLFYTQQETDHNLHTVMAKLRKFSCRWRFSVINHRFYATVGGDITTPVFIELPPPPNPPPVSSWFCCFNLISMKIKN